MPQTSPRQTVPSQQAPQGDATTPSLAHTTPDIHAKPDALKRAPDKTDASKGEEGKNSAEGTATVESAAAADNTAAVSADFPFATAEMDACFKAFDKDEDGFLSQQEFSALCRALFRNERGKPYPVDSSMLATIFTIFDTNKDNVIDKEEFRYCWQKWIKQVVRPVTALVVVDVQNDFITGSLAISKCPAGHNGEEVIPIINRLLEENTFDLVVYSLDWHPENHVSFIDTVHLRPLHSTCKINKEAAKVMDTMIFDVNNDGVAMEQKLWPRHCVQKTWGAELHQDLKIVENAIFVYKGTDPDTDSYSAFWDNNKKAQTTLNEEMKKRNVTDVFICGIAYDVCVAATTKHAIEEGYRTILVDNGCRGVCESDIEATKDHTTSINGLVIHSSQVKGLATGRDRPPILAYRMALELAKSKIKK